MQEEGGGQRMQRPQQSLSKTRLGAGGAPCTNCLTPPLTAVSLSTSHSSPSLFSHSLLLLSPSYSRACYTRLFVFMYEQRPAWRTYSCTHVYTQRHAQDGDGFVSADDLYQFSVSAQAQAGGQLGTRSRSAVVSSPASHLSRPDFEVAFS